MKPLSLLLVTHYYPNHRGGVEIVAGKLVDYLLETGNYRITWLACNVDIPPANRDNLVCLAMAGTNIIEEKLAIPYPLWSLGALWTLWKAVKAADIVHLHDYLYWGNLWAFMFAKLQRKPVVITQHIGFIPYNSLFFRTLLSTLNATLGQVILRHTNATVFISEVVQNYFFGSASSVPHSYLIPNGVDGQRFVPVDFPTRQQHRQGLGLPGDRQLCLFAGRFVEKKGLLILKELATRFQTVHWVFAGWGGLDPEDWRLPNVTVARNLTSIQLIPYYQTADLLVLPSKGEGFPLVVQEAMACGTPAAIGTETAKACSAAWSLFFMERVEGEDVVNRWQGLLTTVFQEPETLEARRQDVATFAHNYWDWQKTAVHYDEIFKGLV
jgi:glycosyltransferase involved in cell wall biosynthesis